MSKAKITREDLDDIRFFVGGIVAFLTLLVLGSFFEIIFWILFSIIIAIVLVAAIFFLFALFFRPSWLWDVKDDD